MKTEEFKNALEQKKVPLLVLDQKWHRLFAIHGKTEEIKEEESNLNALLAKQGKLNSDLKDLKRLKSKIMNDIMDHMDTSSSATADREKKMEDNKRLMDEINEKIRVCEDELLDIPKAIHASNENLMILSMEYFYEKLRVNKEEAIEIEEWINQVRVELKKNIIRKQNREINNKEIYSYLHDIFGMEVLNLFDVPVWHSLPDFVFDNIFVKRCKLILFVKRKGGALCQCGRAEKASGQNQN